MKKFELTNEFVVNIFGIKLFRIRSLVSFGCVKAGEQGGYVEKEGNLSQIGDAWIFGNAQVYGNAQVSDNAQVSGNARVYGDAQVSGKAQVYGNARVYGDTRVSGNAQVYGDAWISSDARVHGDTDYATVKGFGRYNRNTTFFRCKDAYKKILEHCEVMEYLYKANKDKYEAYHNVAILCKRLGNLW